MPELTEKESAVHSTENKIQLKKSLTMVCACGIVSAFLTLMLNMLALALGLKKTVAGMAATNALITVTAVLLPAWCFSLPLGGIKRFFADRKRLSTFDNIALGCFGLGTCVTLNFIVGLLALIMPFLGNSSAVNTRLDPIDIIMLTGSMAVVPAVCEEIAYRGFAFGSMRKYGVLYASVISSLVFGMLHSSFSSALFAFLSGMLFALLRQCSGSLMMPLIVHFLNNTIAVLGSAAANTFNGEAYQEIYIASVLAAVFLMLASFVVLYARGVHLFSALRGFTIPLTFRQKLACTFSCPAFDGFLFVTLLLKYM